MIGRLVCPYFDAAGGETFSSGDWDPLGVGLTVGDGVGELEALGVVVGEGMVVVVLTNGVGLGLGFAS